jgi:hypothetical protein
LNLIKKIQKKKYLLMIFYRINRAKKQMQYRSNKIRIDQEPKIQNKLTKFSMKIPMIEQKHLNKTKFQIK